MHLPPTANSEDKLMYTNEGTRSHKLQMSCLMLLVLLTASGQAVSECYDGERDTATRMVQQARGVSDEIERIVLLKRSLKICPDFVPWLEVGRMEMALENASDAIIALENARDFYLPAADGSLPRSSIRRRAVANSWLAEAYQLDSDLARASVAVQEAKNDFASVGYALPGRLLQLQASIDDGMASAGANVIARSLQLQHERATRGIGVRPVVREQPEQEAHVQETDNLQLAYETNTAPLEDVVASNVPVVREPVQASLGTSALQPVAHGTESRLNIPVLFAYDSADLTAESRKTSQQLGMALTALNLTENDVVTIVGHTDSQGSAQYNRALSLRRARTVLREMQALINSNPVFETVGRGEQELRYNGSTENDHRRNRRVEIIVKR